VRRTPLFDSVIVAWGHSPATVADLLAAVGGPALPPSRHRDQRAMSFTVWATGCRRVARKQTITYDAAGRHESMGGHRVGVGQ
jgi:hypothetical protein